MYIKESNNFVQSYMKFLPFSRIYRCGDRDRHTTPIHSHFWGRGDTGTLL